MTGSGESGKGSCRSACILAYEVVKQATWLQWPILCWASWQPGRIQAGGLHDTSRDTRMTDKSRALFKTVGNNKGEYCMAWPYILLSAVL